MNNYYVVNLEDVNIMPKSPYTLVFKGYVPTYGQSNKLYTFRYDGDVAFTDAPMSDDIKEDFAEQLMEYYDCGIMFDIIKVKNQLKKKSQYRMKI